MERYRNEPMNTPEQKLRQELAAAYSVIKEMSEYLDDYGGMSGETILEKHKEIISKARGEK
jgi:hypothetical protein